MISKIATRRPVTTIMITLMALLGGMLAYFNLDLALMPNVDLPMAIVSTTYVGAGPEEVANLVSSPLEEALGSVTNVDSISSISSSDSSMVIIQFVDGTDIDMATVDVREVLDRVKGSLPEDCNSPNIIKMDLNATPISIGISSNSLDLNSLNILVNDSIVPKIERMEGIASVDVSGGIETEIQLIVDPDRLDLYGLSISTLSQMLQAENMNLPSGTLDQGSTSVNVRVLGQFENLTEVKKLPLSTPSGAKVLLEEIAIVQEVETNRNSATYVNGMPSILIEVNKQSTANLVKVSESLQEELNSLSKEFTECSILMLSDTSDFIQASIDNVTYTALLSAVIAFFVLLVFLKNPVTATIIAISIPTSIFIAFGVMFLFNMSLNTISMGGITIGIGMLVDNSIVVLDSIYGYYEKGHSPRESAERGASEVTMSILASTLTTIAVFLPMIFVQGTVGDMMNNLSLTITFTLSASLIVSITFVPMACALLLQKSVLKVPRKNIFTLIGFIWDLALNSISKFYEIILKVALHLRAITVAFIITFFMATLEIIPLIGIDFMETTDEGVAGISITLPSGTKFEVTEETTLEALYRLESIPEIEVIYANISSSSASITMNLNAKEDRNRSTADIAKEAEKLLQGLAGAEVVASASSNAMGGMGGTDVEFNIYGYDISELMEVEQDVINMLKNSGRFGNVEGSTKETVPEAQIIINRSLASNYGISTSTIAGALNTVISGTTATQYKVDGVELDMVIKYNQDNGVEYISDLSGIKLDTQSGGKVYLSDVAEVVIAESSTQINRENQINMVTISVGAGDYSGSESQDLLVDLLDSYAFPEGYSYGFGGTIEMMNDAVSSMVLCIVIAIILVYMIMASQFESLGSPFIVMFSMPLAITGGFLGLYIMDKTITMTAMMGFVMLVGMVVNNAIVLVDYTNQLIDDGMNCYEALTTAGPRRIRPILMTTMTTSLGMIPLIISDKEGSETMEGLAITVVFGLMFSTIVTLILIPILYSWLHGIGSFFKNIRRKFLIKKEKRIRKKLAKLEKRKDKKDSKIFNRRRKRIQKKLDKINKRINRKDKRKKARKNKRLFRKRGYVQEANINDYYQTVFFGEKLEDYEEIMLINEFDDDTEDNTENINKRTEKIKNILKNKLKSKKKIEDINNIGEVENKENKIKKKEKVKRKNKSKIKEKEEEENKEKQEKEQNQEENKELKDVVVTIENDKIVKVEDVEIKNTKNTKNKTKNKQKEKDLDDINKELKELDEELKELKEKDFIDDSEE